MTTTLAVLRFRRHEHHKAMAHLPAQDVIDEMVVEHMFADPDKEEAFLKKCIGDWNDYVTVT